MDKIITKKKKAPPRYVVEDDGSEYFRSLKKPKLSLEEQSFLYHSKKKKKITSEEESFKKIKKVPLHFNLYYAELALTRKEFLLEAFRFTGTKEGADYWERIYDKGHTEGSLKKLKNMIKQNSKKEEKIV